MIKDIDGSEVKGPCMIDSPFLGPIPPERLSGGVKTLILMQNDPDHIFNASACGNNLKQMVEKQQRMIKKSSAVFVMLETGRYF